MFRKSCFLIAVFLTCFAAGCATNPITGQSQLMLFPESQDIMIGRQYAPEVEKQLGGRIDDQQLQDYVSFVGRQIVRVSHYRNFDYHFVAVQDKSINAMALPGGYVFITRGMLEKLQTEAQLAAILGHEVVHIVARHSSAAISGQIGTDILLSTVISDSPSQGVQTITSLARTIIDLRYSRKEDLRYSRKDEREADLAGLDYLVGAGYNPYGMVETMQILEQQQKFATIGFLSSHPAPENRQVYLTDKIEMSYFNLAGLKIGTEEYRTAVLDRLR
jgi:predicted Zn-dependent protease